MPLVKLQDRSLLFRLERLSGFGIGYDSAHNILVKSNGREITFEEESTERGTLHNAVAST